MSQEVPRRQNLKNKNAVILLLHCKLHFNSTEYFGTIFFTLYTYQLLLLIRTQLPNSSFVARYNHNQFQQNYLQELPIPISDIKVIFIQCDLDTIIMLVSKALVRSKNLTALALSRKSCAPARFFQDLALAFKTFERRSILRSF